MSEIENDLPPKPPVGGDEPGYEVGYGRPPAASRFRNGQSGNPRGRPRGARDRKAAVSRVANELLEFKMVGVVHSLSRLEIALHMLRFRAAAGDARALEAWEGLLNTFDPQVAAQGVLMVPEPMHPRDWIRTFAPEQADEFEETYARDPGLWDNMHIRLPNGDS